MKHWLFDSMQSVQDQGMHCSILESVIDLLYSPHQNVEINEICGSQSPPVPHTHSTAHPLALPVM